MGSSWSTKPEPVEVKPAAPSKTVPKQPELDLSSAGPFQPALESIVKTSTHPKIRQAIEVLIEQVVPLLDKPGTARAIDDILTKQLEILDCVDVSQNSDVEGTNFRQARREFASLCTLIDESVPPEGHVRPAPAQAGRKKKRRKSNK